MLNQGDALIACMAEAGGGDEGGGAEDPAPPNHPCGDGVCDDVERNNPQLCPRDCEDRPDDFEWCGDGLCDALERHQGSCAEDCGGGNRNGGRQDVQARGERYEDCRARDLGCAPGCAATRAMLLTVETPVIEDNRP